MNDAIFKANNTSGFPQKLKKSVCGGGSILQNWLQA